MRTRRIGFVRKFKTGSLWLLDRVRINCQNVSLEIAAVKFSNCVLAPVQIRNEGVCVKNLPPTVSPSLPDVILISPPASNTISGTPKPSFVRFCLAESRYFGMEIYVNSYIRSKPRLARSSTSATDAINNTLPVPYKSLPHPSITRILLIGCFVLAFLFSSIDTIEIKFVKHEFEATSHFCKSCRAFPLWWSCCFVCKYCDSSN